MRSEEMRSEHEVDVPLRVALFTDTFAPQMNGVARTLARWEQTLSSRGHFVRVFTTTAPGVDDSRQVRRFASVPFWGYEELRLSVPHLFAARKELAAFRPHLVHAATPFGVGLAGRWAARQLGIPLVTSYHTSLTQYAKYYGLGTISGAGMKYLRWFHNSGLRTFVPTETVALELERAGFRNLSIWSRGVDGARFHPGFRDATLRVRMGAGHDGIVVAYVGRVAAEKGVDVAARAMREVVRQCPRTVFAVAGDGPAMAQCRQLTPVNSWFAGRLDGDALSMFYASADIFVFPSTTDTFGNVLMEAMASGLPVIAADVPQSREVVGTEAGRYFTASDPQSLATAITRLAQDPAALDRMRTAAILRARSRSWHAIFDRLLSDYRLAAGIRHRANRAGGATLTDRELAVAVASGADVRAYDARR